MKNKVLVAMGIGIFAALTFNAASVTTLADDNNEPQNPDENDGYNFDTEMEEAVKAANDSNTSVAAVVETITGEDGVLQAEQDLENAAEKVLGLDPNVDKAEDPMTKAEHVYAGTSLEEDKEECFEMGEAGQLKEELLGDDEKVDAQELLNNIGNDESGLLKEMKDQELLAAGLENGIITAAGNVNDVVDKADKLVEEANNLVGTEPDPENSPLLANISKAGEIVDGASVVIEGAGSPEEAEATMNTAQQAADNADADVKAAAKRISDIEAELDDLSKEYKAKVELYEEKVGQLNDAKKRFDEAKADAVNDSEALVDEIDRLSTEADQLYAAAQLSQSQYRDEGYRTIKAYEEYLETKSGVKDLSEYRKLVYYTMKYYYIPDVIGGVMDEDDTFEKFNSDWQELSGAYTYHDENNKEFKSNKGDVLRYGKVYYTVKDDQGNDQSKTMYVNYKAADANNLKNPGYAGIVIFEKTVHVQYQDKDLPSYIQEALETVGTYVDGDTTFRKESDEKYFVKEGNIKEKELKVRFRNDNWYSGNVILYEYDRTQDDNNSYLTDGVEGDATKEVKINRSLNDDFRNKIDNLELIPNALDDLVTKAQASQDAFIQAKADVATLERQIKDLKCDHEIAQIRVLNTDLAAAKETLRRATEERDDLLQKLDDLRTLYQQKINEFEQIPAQVVTEAPLIVASAPADDFVAAAPEAVTAAPAPAGAVLGANRPVAETAQSTVLGAQRSSGVLGERRGPQAEVLGKRRSPKTADGAMGGMVAGMMLSMMSVFGGAKVLKKKDEE